MSNRRSHRGVGPYGPEAAIGNRQCERLVNRAVRVLYLGDSPRASTGFGVVASQLCRGFVEAGLCVTCLGASDTRRGSFPYRLVPVSADDPYGIGRVKELVEQTQPDVAFVCHELRLTRTWVHLAKEQAPRLPVVAYRGIPGDPLPEPWVDALREVDLNVAYTHYARRVMKRDAGVVAEMLRHGVDLQVFRPLSDGERATVRRVAGWEKRFVVLYVGRNRPNKGHPELIEAVSLLHNRGIDEILCYLQCVPVEREAFRHPEKGFVLGGWNLKDIARKHGIAQAVVFPAHYHEAARGTSHGGRAEHPATALDLGLVHLYGAADLYVHPSLAETFGLPLLEAMACGLPVLHRDDGGNMNEVTGEASLRLNATRYVDDGYGGRALVGLDPKVIAQGITRAREMLSCPEERSAWVSRCVSRASEFPWAPIRKRMAEIVKEIACRNARK